MLKNISCDGVKKYVYFIKAYIEFAFDLKSLPYKKVWIICICRVKNNEDILIVCRQRSATSSLTIYDLFKVNKPWGRIKIIRPKMTVVVNISPSAKPFKNVFFYKNVINQQNFAKTIRSVGPLFIERKFEKFCTILAMISVNNYKKWSYRSDFNLPSPILEMISACTNHLYIIFLYKT